MKLWICLFALSFRAQAAPALQAGDIVFQDSQSSQSEAVKAATRSEWSHCGIVLEKDGELQVLEAVGPVKWSGMAAWIKRGVGDRYEVRRLKDPSPLKAKGALKKLKKAALGMLGRPYDFYFGWSDSRVYCSELVWKAYARGLGLKLSETRKLKEFDLSHPAVQAKLKERYGNKIPLEEPMVSPEDIWKSIFLE